MQGAPEGGGALASVVWPAIVAAGLLPALRACDARRFPRNALWLALAVAAALALRSAVAALLPVAPGPTAVAGAAAAAGLVHAFRGRGRAPARLAAAGLALAGFAAGGETLLLRAAGFVLGAGVALALLRALEIFHGLGAPDPLPPLRDRAQAGPARILFVAGEASADRYGAHVLAAIREREPGAVAFGIGGPRLREAGLVGLADAGELAIVGFTGVLAALPHLAGLYRRLVALLDRERPDVVVAIDLPDWNAMLALQARARGVPTLVFVAPQVWAWRAGRVAKLAPRISRLVVLFPFEAAAWERAGVSVACHGHPLAEELAPRVAPRAEARARLGLDPERPLLALAPGSRPSEIAHHTAPLLDAAARLAAALPGLELAVPLAPRVPEAPLREAAARAGLALRCFRDSAFEIFLASDFGLVCSGTAALEAALAGLPMVVFYRGGRLDAALARRFVRIDRIALPNVLLGGPAPVFPELFQQQVTGERLAEAALAALRDPARLAALREAGARVRELVPARPTAAAVAGEVLALARREPGRVGLSPSRRGPSAAP
jgi:lipid-A-disaccharide synthase